VSGLVAYRLHQHAAHLRAVGRPPRDLFLLAEREAAHLRVRVGQLRPRGAVGEAREVAYDVNAVGGVTGSL
jgi:hypothetical protein